MNINRWPIAQHAPPLAADEIHLWLANLDQPPQPLAVLAATLAADERERAARFRFPEHRAGFIAGRGLLRVLLGRYLDRPAAALCFKWGAQGKPTLVEVDAATDLCFNLSHSGNRALYAVARREVGVDIEARERRVNYAAVLERVCTPREWAVFQALPAAQLQPAFFTCWTRKEAMIKAWGGGLASGLRTLEVCFPADSLPDDRIRLHDGAGREWSVLNLPLEPGWSGALAAVGTDWQWRGWCWT